MPGFPVYLKDLTGAGHVSKVVGAFSRNENLKSSVDDCLPALTEIFGNQFSKLYWMALNGFCKIATKPRRSDQAGPSISKPLAVHEVVGGSSCLFCLPVAIRSSLLAPRSKTSISERRASRSTKKGSLHRHAGPVRRLCPHLLTVSVSTPMRLIAAASTWRNTSSSSAIGYQYTRTRGRIFR